MCRFAAKSLRYFVWEILLRETRQGAAMIPAAVYFQQYFFNDIFNDTVPISFNNSVVMHKSICFLFIFKLYFTLT